MTHAAFCCALCFGLYTNHLFSTRTHSGEIDADFPDSLLLVVTSPLWRGGGGTDGEVAEMCD